MRERFHAFARSHGADQSAAERWWRELESRHSESDRHYHTLRHIAHMLDLLPHADETVLAAVWFHDAVYGGRANEEESARLMRQALEELRFPPETIANAETLILATKSHDAARVDPRFHSFLDADLAILGSDRERYGEYVDEVRQEYAHMPEPLFRGGRAAILDNYLARPRIYATDEFHDRFEKQARANMAWEISGGR